jgi:hypothetical protein
MPNNERRILCIHIPDASGAVIGGGEDLGAVGTEYSKVYQAYMAREDDRGARAIGAPDTSGAIP